MHPHEVINVSLLPNTYCATRLLWKHRKQCEYAGHPEPGHTYGLTDPPWWGRPRFRPLSSPPVGRRCRAAAAGRCGDRGERRSDGGPETTVASGRDQHSRVLNLFYVLKHPTSSRRVGSLTVRRTVAGGIYGTDVTHARPTRTCSFTALSSKDEMVSVYDWSIAAPATVGLLKKTEFWKSMRAHGSCGAKFFWVQWCLLLRKILAPRGQYFSQQKTSLNSEKNFAPHEPWARILFQNSVFFNNPKQQVGTQNEWDLYLGVGVGVLP